MPHTASRRRDVQSFLFRRRWFRSGSLYRAARVASSKPRRSERICACATHAPSPKAWLDSKETPPSPPGWRRGERAGGSFASGAAVAAVWSRRARSGALSAAGPAPGPTPMSTRAPWVSRARVRAGMRDPRGGAGGCQVAHATCAPVGEVSWHTAGPPSANSRRARAASTSTPSDASGAKGGGVEDDDEDDAPPPRRADARRSPRLAPGRQWGHAARRAASNAADTDAAAPSPRGAIPD